MFTLRPSGLLVDVGSNELMALFALGLVVAFSLGFIVVKR